MGSHSFRYVTELNWNLKLFFKRNFSPLNRLPDGRAADALRGYTGHPELLVLLEREEVDGVDARLFEVGDHGLVDVPYVRTDEGHSAESQVLDRLDGRRQGVRDVSCLAAGIDQFPNPTFPSPVLICSHLRLHIRKTGLGIKL